jgi:hypothetical protein
LPACRELPVSSMAMGAVNGPCRAATFLAADPGLRQGLREAALQAACLGKSIPGATRDGGCRRCGRCLTVESTGWQLVVLHPLFPITRHFSLPRDGGWSAWRSGSRGRGEIFWGPLPGRGTCGANLTRSKPAPSVLIRVCVDRGRADLEYGGCEPLAAARVRPTLSEASLDGSFRQPRPTAWVASPPQAAALWGPHRGRAERAFTPCASGCETLGQRVVFQGSPSGVSPAPSGIGLNSASARRRG